MNLSMSVHKTLETVDFLWSSRAVISLQFGIELSVLGKL